MSSKILYLLKGKDSFVSGASISSDLGITRAGVWKKIKNLREQGFIIEAVPSKGYRLIRSPDLSEDAIISQINNNFWKKIMLFKSIDSTNDLASRLSAKKVIETGTVIIADSQSTGKGRLRRKWFSPAGVNIYLSIVLRPEIEPKDATLLTIMASNACASAISETTGLDIRIKWPNDLEYSGKKLGGILTEIRSEPDKINIAIIGIGINVNMEGKTLPDDIKTSATSIKNETGNIFSRSEIISLILNNLEHWQETLKNNGRTLLLKKWKELSTTIGKNVKVTVGKNNIFGFAEDIDDEGRLILRTQSGIEQKISAGDITILR